MRQGLAAAYGLGVFVEWFHWVGFVTLIYWLPSSEGDQGPLRYYLVLVAILTAASVVAVMDGVRDGALTRGRIVAWFVVSGLQCLRLVVMAVIVGVLVSGGIPATVEDAGFEMLLLVYLGAALFLFRAARVLGNATPVPGPEQWGLALAAMTKGRLPGEPGGS